MMEIESNKKKEIHKEFLQESLQNLKGLNIGGKEFLL